MLYLDIPSSAQIVRLSETRSDAAVTIYLATTPLTQEIEQARISLKNLTREAVSQLQAAGVDKRQIWPIEEAIEELAEDNDFWAHQAYGLAIFVTPERLRRFRLANRLEDSVHVSDRFHLKPLLRATAFGHDAYVMDIAEGGVRLIDVPASGAASEIRVKDLPKDASDALGKATLTDLAQIARAATAGAVDTLMLDMDVVVPGRLDEEGGMTLTDLAQIARAATAGAVDTLMLDMDVVVPGRLDEEGGMTLAESEDATTYGVTDQVAARVMAGGGRIVALRSADLPDPNSPVAAILRFPM